MSISNLPLMKAMAAKMDYLDKRQGILAQNMANADTPNYQSKDIADLCMKAVSLPPVEAKDLQPLMADMIGNLERLGSALKDFRDNLKH